MYYIPLAYTHFFNEKKISKTYTKTQDIQAVYLSDRILGDILILCVC